jgi:hypothetical protein
MRWTDQIKSRRSALLGLAGVVAGLLLCAGLGQAARAQAVQPDPDALLAPGDASSYDNFGAALAINGDWLAVGATGVDLEGARNAGAVYLFQRQGGAWREVTRLLPDPAQVDGRFGSALAFDGDTLAVGAPYEYNPGSGNASGAVYVFVRSRNNWSKSARLAVTDGMPFDLFGGALALRGDTLAVGARAADSPQGQRDAGAVYILRRDGEAWRLQARLSASDRRAFDHFGHALAFAGDELLVGAPDVDAPGAPNSGLVYRYRNTGAGWSEQERLTPQEIKAEARFGYAFSIDGDLLAVLAPQEYRPSGAMPSYAFAWESTFGVAHVYTRQGAGWEWQTRLVPEPVDDWNVIMPRTILVDGQGHQARVALGGYSRGQIYTFEGSGENWQALPVIEIPSMSLVDGGALVGSSDQLLLASRLQDRPGMGANYLQSPGAVLLADW